MRPFPRQAFQRLQRQLRPHQMSIRHPPIEQCVRQPFSCVERQPAELRHRLIAAAHMRCPEYRVVEAKTRRGEFEGVFRNCLPRRKRDHPFGAGLPERVRPQQSWPRANAWRMANQAQRKDGAESAISGQIFRLFAGQRNDGDALAWGAHALSAVRMGNARIDCFKAVRAAVIVVVGYQRTADLPAGIDAELEIRPFYLVAVAKRPVEAEQSFGRRERRRCWNCLASTSRSGRRNPATFRALRRDISWKTYRLSGSWEATSENAPVKRKLPSR